MDETRERLKALSSSSSEREVLPPLRLHHFLVWMAVAAPCLTFTGAGANIAPAWLVFSQVPGFLSGALAVTCCGFGIWWRRRGLPFPRDPGHWICIMFCVTIPFMLLHLLLASLCLEFDDQGIGHYRQPIALTEWYDQWGWRTSFVPSIAVTLWVATRWSTSRRWMWVFLLSAIFQAIYAFDGRASNFVVRILEPLNPFTLPLYQTVGFLTDAHQVLPSVVLCWACWADYQEGIPRHWSHWCGIIAWLSVLPGSIAIATVNMGWISAPW